jgi:hypothetical protein
VRDDPYASLSTTLLLTAASLVFAAVALSAYRSLLRLPSRAEVPAHGDHRP